MKVSHGAMLIAKERTRQVEEEGWDDAHDDDRETGSLAVAGACYALDVVAKNENVHFSWQVRYAELAGELFPFDREWWKPTLDPIRELVKAGALIAAEIDRLHRLT